ncbi:unnamed protein product [Calypogeia fissa]
MEDVEARRRRLAAMREEADAAQNHEGNVTSIPSFSAPLLSNPLDDSSAENAAIAAKAEAKSSSFDFYTDPLAGYSGSKRKKTGVGVLATPSQAPSMPNDPSRHGRAGLLPSPLGPPHLQPAGVFPPPPSLLGGPPSWQPIVYQPPPALYSNPGFAYQQPSSGWEPVGYQIPYTNPIFPHPQPPAQFQPQCQPPPERMNQWSNQTSGRGRGRGGGGDRGFSGRHNGRQSPNSPAGVDSWRHGNAGEGRGAHGRGQGTGRIVSAKEQPHLFFKNSMLEDPWQALEVGRMGRT